MTKPYRIYGFSTCPFCERAKELLAKAGIPFDYVEIPTPEDRKDWMDARGFVTPHRTFPRVYALNGGCEHLIGGFDDLEADVFFNDCA